MALNLVDKHPRGNQYIEPRLRWMAGKRVNGRRLRLNQDRSDGPRSGLGTRRPPMHNSWRRIATLFFRRTRPQAVVDDGRLNSGWRSSKANEVPYAMNHTLARKPVADMTAMALTFVLAVGLAFGISAAFGSRSIASSLGDGAPLEKQAIWGAAIGLIFSIPIVTAVLRMPVFLRLREHSIERSRMIDLRGFNPIWISLFAGIGEEILFRGAIQPLLGLWLTSAIFSLGHIQPSQYRSISAGTIWYAGFVFLASVLLGSVYSHFGLVSAMAFHTTGDLVGLFSLRRISRTAIADGKATG